MRAAQHRRLTPLLAGLGALALLAWVALLAGIGRQVHWSAADSAPALPAAGGAASLPPPPPLQHYAAIWQRPLFNADRKPAPTSAADPGNARLGDLELTGILITPGLKMALLHNRSTNEELRVREGASVAGRWTLQSLEPRQATFVGEGGRTVLPLKVAAHIDASGHTAATAGNGQDDTSRMMHVDHPPPPGAHGTQQMHLQQQDAAPPSAAQIRAGMEQKARIKALRQRIEDQRRRQRAPTHDREH